MNRYRYYSQMGIVVLISAVLSVSSASADIIFESGTLGPTAHATQVTFEWVTVGNAGNIGEISGCRRCDFGGPVAIVGGVDYAYRISKTEVSNAQYAEFLNAVDPTATNSLGLFNTGMASYLGGIENTGATDGARYIAQMDRENNPVTYVSWYDSIRFINWLNNGQPTVGGGTESGAYTLDGNTSIPTNSLSVVRDANATYWLPSEDEWYKAAYYDPSSGIYYDYATGSDTVPVSDQPGDGQAAANYYNDDNLANGFNDGFAVSGSTSLLSIITTNPFTDVGAYTDASSPYGTYDQNGNVNEWNEEVLGIGSSSIRGLRGGSWVTGASAFGGAFDNSPLAALERGLYAEARFESYFTGFRVARSIPEPATFYLATLGGTALLLRRRSALRL